MSRLSIEVTPEQHQRLKAIAALSGMTIKEYVLARVLPPEPEPDDLSEDVLRVPAFEGAVLERDQVELRVHRPKTHVRNSRAGLDSARRRWPK